ncbi:MAG: XRE family transcriptional regulator [Clostridia bacterium]|nr:XRE family transcriptional regulator [Clostridia bacterium]
MLNLTILGENIKGHRIRLKLSQNQLAEQMMVSFQAISNWERGITPPDLDNLCKLSRLYGVSLDALIGHSAQGVERTMIGVDGGGTKTEFVLFSESGQVLRRFRLGQSNPSNVGMDGCFAILSEGIDTLMEYSPNVCGVFAGMAGMLSEPPVEQVRAYLKIRYKNIYTQVDNDAVNVMLSGKNADNGMALICGTGSVLMARENGISHRYGGWGTLFDDPGSAYNIAKNAIQAILYEEDGIGEPTMLTGLLKEKCGLQDKPAWEVLNLQYNSGKEATAALAPAVFEAYTKGDQVAAAILDRNAEMVAKLINAARSRHKCGNEVIACGGIFEHNHKLFEPLIQKHLNSHLKFIYPELPPVYGACVGCCQALKVTVDDAFYQNFRDSYRCLQDAETAKGGV